MFKITYYRASRILQCKYETTEYSLFKKTLEELENDSEVYNIAIEKNDGFPLF